MNQCKHISDLLIEFNFHHYFHVFAFVDSSVKLPLDMGVHLADPSIYRRLFGKLNFFQHIKPDIAYIVQHLSQFL